MTDAWCTCRMLTGMQTLLSVSLATPTTTRSAFSVSPSVEVYFADAKYVPQCIRASHLSAAVHPADVSVSAGIADSDCALSCRNAVVCMRLSQRCRQQVQLKIQPEPQSSQVQLCSKPCFAVVVLGEEEGTGLHRVWLGGCTCSQKAAPLWGRQ